MIYKNYNKGSRSPSSYRLISLANAIYKLYASLLHLRRSKAVDPFFNLSNTDFDPTALSLPLSSSFGGSLKSLKVIPPLFPSSFLTAHKLLTPSVTTTSKLSQNLSPTPSWLYATTLVYLSTISLVTHPLNRWVVAPNKDVHLVLTSSSKSSPLSPLTSTRLFQTIFTYTPWTFSSRHPSSDIEYADDTVRMARSNDHSQDFPTYCNTCPPAKACSSTAPIVNF